ncbi:NUDIX domain-containing protein [Burkholderia multivorans]|nr:NUDIX domain-containing protein [Burkholderia multivorans]PRG68343.1 NUDIX domain-containing protein [Burkholderia multivorans]QGR92478.1 NUDIX domain-containing protein [Burkholderia multivorans]
MRAPPRARCARSRMRRPGDTLAITSSLPFDMKFCSVCGHEVIARIPQGDNRERFVCDHCGTIHYQNPRNVVGTVPVWGEQVLLCRRAIEPRYGFWTLPAGFMEMGETTAEAAARETLEEAGARVEVQNLFTLLNVPHVHQVHLFYLARLVDPEFEAGEESLEVKLFDEADIPWDEIAFPTVSQTLRFFFADRATGDYGVHTGDIFRSLRNG